MDYKLREKIIKNYASCNAKCPFCLAPVTLKDIYNNNYVYSETKRKGKMLAHRICVERNLRP